MCFVEQYKSKRNMREEKDDYLKGKVEVTAGDSITKIDHLGTIFGPEDIQWVSMMYYNSESNSMCTGQLIFDKEFDTFEIFIDDDRGNTTCYVASEDEEMQPNDILERFQRIGGSYWDKE